MASVNGLVHVRVVRCVGLQEWPLSASFYLRVRLLPWREEGTTGSVHADASGEAVWGEEDGACVALAHLSTEASQKPCVRLEVRSREMYVYERAVGSAEVDAASLVAGVKKEKITEWAEVREGVRVALELSFSRGATLPRISSKDVLRQHLFRLTTYTRPTWCAVCEQLLVGIRHQGFRCEACGLDCHRDCQLKAHAVRECSRALVSKTPDETLLDEEDEEDWEEFGGRSTHVAPSREAPWLSEPSRGPGYFGPLRTHTVYESAEPRFDATWVFPISTFSSEVRLELVDAARDLVVGTLRFGVLDLEQEEADRVATDAAAYLDKACRAYVVGGDVLADAFWERRNKMYFPASTLKTGKIAASEIVPALRPRWPIRRRQVQPQSGRRRPVVFELAETSEPEPPPETFSMELARRHVERARQVIRWINETYEAYERVMRWTDPLITAPLFAAFVATCVWLDAEHVGVVPLALLVAFFLATARNRLLGHPRKTYFEHAARLAEANHLGHPGPYRPLGRLRVARRGWHDLDDLDLDDGDENEEKTIRSKTTTTRRRVGSASPLNLRLQLILAKPRSHDTLEEGRRRVDRHAIGLRLLEIQQPKPQRPHHEIPRRVHEFGRTSLEKVEMEHPSRV
ncbi:hypothetical protein CTAYLR_005509 [Chrysophaeum taylorii]|uniref:Protein kinase C n=1 Tax=Chrysophaeum taylorii TaxID=2483200 RepID=A0AAD7U4H1_9STRA|nr:hypothetical protein CTAYLR_005509 [Chrysophaeum taylorii]